MYSPLFWRPFEHKRRPILSGHNFVPNAVHTPKTNPTPHDTKAYNTIPPMATRTHLHDVVTPYVPCNPAYGYVDAHGWV